MSEAEFSTIQCYFTATDWAQFSHYEKQVYVKRKENFEKLKELGIAGQPPPFMRPQPAPPAVRLAARAKRSRAASVDSGDDWSPSRCVRPAPQRDRPAGRRGAARPTKFRPPVKKTATETRRLEVEVSKATATKPQPGGGDDQQDQLEQPEKDIPERPPSPPYDFRGFTVEDQYKARNAVDTRGERLWNIIISEFRAMGEEPPEREIFKRQRKKVNYKEDDDLDDDDYIFCDECDREWEGDCPVHGPLEVVPDTKVPVDPADPDRAEKTLPDFLSTGRSKIPDANIGIWTEKELPARHRFGPYEGVVTGDRRQATLSGYSWEIKKFRRVHHYVDAGNSGCSNWLRLVNCARFEQEQNLVAFQYKSQMYYRTYKPIPKGSELLVYYGDAYARELAIDVRSFRKAQKAPPAPPVATFSDVSLHCDHCSYQCLGQDRLANHVKHRHGHIGRDGRHKCEWCDYSTDWSSSMRSHRRVHTGERPFRCDQCGRAFDRQGSLTRHVLTHTGERPYCCDVCGKTFTDHGSLQRHRRIHTGEIVAVCEQCGAKFNDLSQYSGHMKTHSGVKAHRCELCSARFVRRTDLTTHMRTHTGERPYSCSFCQARFSHQSGMKNHIIVHHTHDYRHRCHSCGKGFVTPGQLRKHADRCSGDN